MSTVKTPTTPRGKAAIDALLNANAQRLGYLRDRWQDEQQYEDWADYETAMQAMVPKGFKLTRALKRPFGFTFTCATEKGAHYQMFVTDRQVGWKRIY